jgi:glycosyltransferase involved in cell wall biosynthesis
MKLSVILLTYNHEKFIAESIEGILTQQVNFPFEIIVADDHSTDRTEEIVEDYRKKNPGLIKGFYNKRNLGARYNLIKAYNCVKGKYIAYCEGDDYWTDPHKLQKQVDFLEKNEDYVLCFHNINNIDAEGNLLETDALKKEDMRDYEVDEMLGVYVPTPTIVYRKIVEKLPAVFKKIDNADTLVLAMLTRLGKAKYLPGIKGSCMRKHFGGIWTSRPPLSRWCAVLKLRYLIFKDIADNALREKTYKEYILIFDKAASDANLYGSVKYWYKYNLRYVQFCITAGKYGKAWLVSKRIMRKIFTN